MKLSETQIRLLRILKVRDPRRIPLVEKALEGDEAAFLICEVRINEMGLKLEDEGDLEWILSLA